MKTTRRRFIIGTGAAIAAAAVPGAVTAAEPAPVLTGPINCRCTISGGWGYSIGGEYWHEFESGALKSKDEALALALKEYPDATSVEVAWCVPRRLVIHDLRDDLVVWLSTEGEADAPLGDYLKLAIEGMNEENDFEGELLDAYAVAKDNGFSDACRLAVAEALMRLDRFDLYARLYSRPEDEPVCQSDVDPALELLASDARLEADLDRIAEAWATSNDLIDAPRVVDLLEHETHRFNPPPADPIPVL